MAKRKTIEQPLSVQFRTQISAATQDKDDAAMELAAVYKRAKEAGLHNGALKLAVKLWRQDETKTAAFLEAFDQYRIDYGLDDQQKLNFDHNETDHAKRAPADDPGPTQTDIEDDPEGDEPNLAQAMHEAIEADGGEPDDDDDDDGAERQPGPANDDHDGDAPIPLAASGPSAFRDAVKSRAAKNRAEATKLN